MLFSLGRGACSEKVIAALAWEGYSGKVSAVPASGVYPDKVSAALALGCVWKH